MPARVVERRTLQDWNAFCDQVQNSTNVPINEAPAKTEARIKRALNDYQFFVETYFPVYASSKCAYFHIDAAKKIQKDPNVLAVLEWPREHAKSVHADVIMPLWLKAQGQLTGMILMGKNADDAANLLSDIQAQLQYNLLYIHDFGDQYNIGSWEEGDFTTQDGVRFLSIGRNQSPRGARKNEKRPNLAVIDDIDDDEIVNNERRVLEVVDRIMSALYFALSIKGARMIVAGNRIHQRSILAHLVGDVSPDTPKRDGIYHSKVYATESKKGVKTYIEEGGKPAWKERYSIDELARKIRKAGPTLAKKEFYHENAVQGKIFKDELIHFKKMPAWARYSMIIGYFDPSLENKPTSDYKAIRVWGLYGEEFHLRGSFVRKTELIPCFIWMGQFQRRLPAGVNIVWYVEKQFYNRPIRDAIKVAEQKLGFSINVIVDTRDKENKYTRMVRMEPRYYNNEVFFDVKLTHDPDTITGNNQLKGIEPGYKSPDDAPDADEGAWHYLEKHLPGRANFTPRIGRRKHKSMF